MAGTLFRVGGKIFPYSKVNSSHLFPTYIGCSTGNMIFQAGGVEFCNPGFIGARMTTEKPIWFLVK